MEEKKSPRAMKRGRYAWPPRRSVSFRLVGRALGARRIKASRDAVFGRADLACGGPGIRQHQLICLTFLPRCRSYPRLYPRSRRGTSTNAPSTATSSPAAAATYVDRILRGAKPADLPPGRSVFSIGEALASQHLPGKSLDLAHRVNQALIRRRMEEKKCLSLSAFHAARALSLK
jgi:hypothetical protein